MFASAALLVAAGAAACTASNDETGGSGGSGNTANTGGNTTTSGTGGNVTTGGSGGTGGDINLFGGQGQGGQEECLATEAEAERKVLDMIVVLDRSGSMSGTSWTGSLAALTTVIVALRRVGLEAEARALARERLIVAGFYGAFFENCRRTKFSCSGSTT